MSNLAARTIIFGYGDVVRSKYLPVFKDSWLKSTIFVDKRTQPDNDAVLLWNGKELDKLVRECKGNINFVIATPPNSHKDVFMYLIQKCDLQKSTIVIEKPFLSSTSIFRENRIIKELIDTNSNIYCLDHYLTKAPIVWLTENVTALVEKYGKISDLEFISLESNSFGNLETFSMGYPIEHGVHALPCFEKIVGNLFQSTIELTVKNAYADYHQEGEYKFINKFNFDFYLNTANKTNCLLQNEVRLNVCCGKMQKENQKELCVTFENAKVRCGINSGKIEVDGETTMLSQNESSYLPIFNWLFEEQDQPSPLLQPNAAMRSVQLMELAIDEL